jgi:hypothetical protein
MADEAIPCFKSRKKFCLPLKAGIASSQKRLLAMTGARVVADR